MLRFVIILAAVAVCYVQSENRYFLYTRANRHEPVNMTTTDETLPELFKPEENTIILVHGHYGSMWARFNTLIMQEIFTFQDQHNVIVVDWEIEARQSYLDAVSNVLPVANDLSHFLTWLATTTKTTSHREAIEGINTEVNILSQVHLVGFDLGAHVAGIAGRFVKYSSGVVGRITGLDPSRYPLTSMSPHLGEFDADYVEVIHTDSSLLGYGIGTAIGRVNFYVNGGRNQPGCLNNSCSHNRAYEVFAASMRGHLFGNACTTSIQMNLNLCTGGSLMLGGTDLSKPSYSNIYRSNSGRDYPF